MAKNMTDTSRFSYEVIMSPNARESVWKRIILCLEWIGEGSNYDIAAWMKVKPEKVWKRTGPKELSCPINGAIFDTGKRGVSPDGNPCIIYSLSSRRSEYAHIPKAEKFIPSKTDAVDYANELIERGKKVQKHKDILLDNHVQAHLFGD